MAMIENVELWWAKLDPKAPVKARDPKDKDYWEVQLRTTDKDMALAWLKKDVKFRPLKRKVRDENGEVVLDEMGEEKQELVMSDEGKPYFFVKVRRKVQLDENGNIALGRNGQPKIVNLVGGDLSQINPNKIGNKSVGNVNLYQYEYVHEGQKKVANSLMGIQVTRLVEYESTNEGFKPTSMEVVKPTSPESDNEHASDHEYESQNDIDDEIPF